MLDHPFGEEIFPNNQSKTSPGTTPKQDPGSARFMLWPFGEKNLMSLCPTISFDLQSFVKCRLPCQQLNSQNLPLFPQIFIMTCNSMFKLLACYLPKESPRDKIRLLLVTYSYALHHKSKPLKVRHHA